MFVVIEIKIDAEGFEYTSPLVCFKEEERCLDYIDSFEDDEFKYYYDVYEVDEI